MITKITKLPEKTQEDKAIEKLIEEFNKEAKNQKSKYRIEMKYGSYLHLVKTLIFGWWEDMSIQMYYNENLDEFSFIGGICKEEFNDIKDIIGDKIPNIKFNIEIV